jgi:hypothetical protein
MERKLTWMHSSGSSGKWTKQETAVPTGFATACGSTPLRRLAIEYGIGDFHYAQLAEGSTHLVSREG